MHKKIISTGLILCMLSTATIASSLAIVVASGQDFSKLQPPLSAPTDIIHSTLEVADVKPGVVLPMDNSIFGASLKDLSNSMITRLGFFNLDTFNYFTPGNFKISLSITDTNLPSPKNKIFQCQQVIYIPKFTDKQNYTLKVTSIANNKCELIKQ